MSSDDNTTPGSNREPAASEGVATSTGAGSPEGAPSNEGSPPRAPEAAPQASSGEASSSAPADAGAPSNGRAETSASESGSAGEASGSERGGSDAIASEASSGDPSGGAERPAGEEPGDDVGNRAPTNRPRLVDGAAVTGDGKKRRRRRRGKKGPGVAAEGAEGAEAAEGAEGAEGEGAEGEGEGAEGEGGEGAEAGPEGGGGRKKLRKKGIPPLRERPAFQIGEEVFGKVSKVTDHAIWVDIAGKATGLFDRREIIDEEPPAEGDQFIATVASTGVRGGMLVMSRAPARLEEARQRVESALETGEYIDGFVTGAVKGGLEVDIGGLRAFAPASHVDLRHGADLSYLVGQRLEIQVTQYAKKGRDIVVSRKKLLEDLAWAERAQHLTTIVADATEKGIVRTVMPWGIFVALPAHGNVEGLVHMTEASHDRAAKLVDLFKPGQEIDVKVVKVDDNGKLWLSHKATIEDPWAAVKEKYAAGSRHKGKVVRLQPFGAFVELEPTIDGLIHTADLSLKLISHPSDVVKVGDEIDVVVANADAGMRRIGLHPAPPESEANEPRQKIAPHKALQVVVHQITEGGLVVRVLGVTGRQARAFIPSMHTGTQRGADLRKTFPLGTRLEAKVIDIDPRRGEAKLSVRALKEDTEKQAFKQYRAEVAKDAKFGTFADLMKKN